MWITDGGIGEVAVKGEGARNLLRHDPINQLAAQYRMTLEGGQALFFRRRRRQAPRLGVQPRPLGLAIRALAKAAKFQRIMLARGTDVVGNQIIVRDLVPLLGVIPKVAHILNQLPGMIHQRVVDRNHPAGRVARLRVLLQPRQPLAG